MKIVKFRFYAELNDFLPKNKRNSWIVFSFSLPVSIKDAIESLGVPHSEIDLILVNGISKNFSYKLKDKDVVSVYPVFELLDVSKLSLVRSKPLRNPKFVLDVHLGKLAKLLRLLGFDTLYRNDFSDKEIVDLSVIQKRIILTRDVGLLKNKKVSHGIFVRTIYPKKQIIEILKRLNLTPSVKPFTRCLECNGKLAKVEKNKIVAKLPPKTKKFYNVFYRCKTCKRIYWQGSHFQNMQKIIKSIV